MRSLTLLSILIASYLATPVVHYENNLARRASNKMEAIIDADVDADANVDANVEADDRHYHHGLLDDLSLARLVRYILHLLGLYDYDFEDNYELLGFLIDNDDITEEEADQLGGIDILGLTRSGHGYGILNNILDLGISLDSDNEYVEEKEEELEYQNLNAIGLGLWAFEGNDGEVEASENN
ncbi:hypothetical protein CONCODRAFT_13938 [Conidiobolus coronatus NRRL 28638]|uniref:EF-hand domain-containing protein n=1 Tax=Conidiobolus coronatus (strain ATCC 28846 / CBS 209.66 / NRRL 28638) TaxID=796925 RepID=A0A137NQ00_CONC2|nr:hypothetical protein CONCODRAFT_13938 [Conidiobolus coronatus NRRL 28638]|eukprot:KXN64780.1 hypothetical protein CONCODRAFT_13938 [Conidiobolus coronatus NRRL 28638]